MAQKLYSGQWVRLGPCSVFKTDGYQHFKRGSVKELKCLKSGLLDFWEVSDLAATGLSSPKKLSSRCPFRGTSM